MHSTAIFKINLSSILQKFKSVQIIEFCNLKKLKQQQKNIVFHNRGRPNGKIADPRGVLECIVTAKSTLME